MRLFRLEHLYLLGVSLDCVVKAQTVSEMVWMMQQLIEELEFYTTGGSGLQKQMVQLAYFARTSECLENVHSIFTLSISEKNAGQGTSGCWFW